MIPIQKRREQLNLSLRKEQLFNFFMDKRLGPAIENHSQEEEKISNLENLFLGITNDSANIPDEEKIKFDKMVLNIIILLLLEW